MWVVDGLARVASTMRTRRASYFTWELTATNVFERILLEGSLSGQGDSGPLGWHPDNVSDDKKPGRSKTASQDAPASRERVEKAQASTGRVSRKDAQQHTQASPAKIAGGSREISEISAKISSDRERLRALKDKKKGE